jgi:Flp pilus assembly protein protease CpaA
VLCVLFVVLEMAISDQLYKVVPDQFSIALACMSIAFLNYHDKWWEPLAGAGVGLAISLIILGLGLLIFRTWSIGGADIKFFTCMGFIAGRIGIVIIYILTTLFFALHAAVKIAAGKGSIKDRNAMMPAAFAAVCVYFLFLWNIADMIIQYI